MESKEATNALDILFSVVGSAENVLRGFIKANSIESTDNADG
jgi:hypothetical protein